MVDKSCTQILFLFEPFPRLEKKVKLFLINKEKKLETQLKLYI